MSETDKAALVANQDGCCQGVKRTNALLHVFFAIMIPVGIMVLLLAPKVCPSGYDEDTCYVYGSGSYPCRKIDGNTIYCHDKVPNAAGTGAGIALIVVGVVAMVILMIVRCCNNQPPCCC